MKRLSLMGLTLTILLLAGCKPTEQGYRAAYEAAQKKEQSALDALGVTAPLQYDDMAIRPVGGDSVWVGQTYIAPLPEDTVKRSGYCYAVARFKMPTNAKAMASDLREAGYPAAFPAADGRDSWYVVPEMFPSIEEAAEAAKRYGASSSRPTVGLPAPVVYRLRP